MSMLVSRRVADEGCGYTTLNMGVVISPICNWCFGQSCAGVFFVFFCFRHSVYRCFSWGEGFLVGSRPLVGQVLSSLATPIPQKWLVQPWVVYNKMSNKCWWFHSKKNPNTKPGMLNLHACSCIHQQNLHLRGNSSLAHGQTPSTISNAKGPHNEETMVVQLWPKHPSLPPPEGTSTGICRLLSDDLYDLFLYSFQRWMGVKISKKWMEMLHMIRMYTYIHSSWEL